MKNLLRLGTLCLILGPGFSLPAFAGNLSGRVTDAATALSLGGVRVRVIGTGQETYTSSSGDYTLVNVPDGARTIEFSYVGYPEVVRQVSVQDDTRLDVLYGEEVVEMERFVIEGAVVGTARAINQQRAASTLTKLRTRSVASPTKMRPRRCNVFQVFRSIAIRAKGATSCCVDSTTRSPP